MGILFDATYDTDTRGVFFTVRKALPLLTEDASPAIRRKELRRR